MALPIPAFPWDKQKKWRRSLPVSARNTNASSMKERGISPRVYLRSSLPPARRKPSWPRIWLDEHCSGDNRSSQYGRLFCLCQESIGERYPQWMKEPSTRSEEHTSELQSL